MYYKLLVSWYYKKLTLSSDPVNISEEIQIFINMSLKTKHLTIRLTEAQFKKLAETLLIEQRTKSSLMRDLLSDYIDRNNSGINKQNKKNNKNPKTLL